MGCAPWLEQLRISTLERALLALGRVARSREATLPAHLIIGLEGEDAAYFYLRGKGYVIVARRWSAGKLPGVVDRIAWQGQLLCVVDVETRTAHDLSRLARQVCAAVAGSTAPEVRFDVVSAYLVPGQSRDFPHFENAFEWSERREYRD